MKEKTCAACDCTLDGAAIKVKIGSRTVEVCCQECARKLGEASKEFASWPRKRSKTSLDYLQAQTMILSVWVKSETEFFNEANQSTQT